ncbi:MAG: class I SAM-dependent methyltransferase [Anaerolineae bacterium]
MLIDLVHRDTHTTAWQKIPWHDPEFSRRMLAEHLSQSHDLASRRFNIIDQQVAWIHHKLFRAQPIRLLDLGCGPGFYMSRFAAMGYTCTGIDLSPASIAYAREHDSRSDYRLSDVRTADFGSGWDAICMIFGELNAFSPEEAVQIIEKAYAALRGGGTLILEVHPYATVYRVGHEPPSWYTAEHGLFSDQPYVCLTESRFEFDRAVSRHYVYDAQTGAGTQYTSMLQGYTDDEYRHLLRAFDRVTFYPSLTGSAETADLFVIAAEK